MDHQIEEGGTGNINHSRLFPILIHEEVNIWRAQGTSKCRFSFQNKRVIAETNAVRQSSRQKQQQISQDNCYYKYLQYKNVRNNKVRIGNMDQQQSNKFSEPIPTCNSLNNSLNSISNPKSSVNTRKILSYVLLIFDNVFQIKRIIRKEVEQVQSTSGLKEKLKLQKSLQKNFSRISSFNGRKEARFNIKVSLQRKLTSMMSYIKIF